MRHAAALVKKTPITKAKKSKNSLKKYVVVAKTRKPRKQIVKSIIRASSPLDFAGFQIQDVSTSFSSLSKVIIRSHTPLKVLNIFINFSDSRAEPRYD